jgi:two-component system chemotaxis response regulator CheY/two-component system phosphate regulon response regulator PhoB
MDNQLRRAVIVEDNAQMRELIHLVLTTFRTEDIVEAKNGTEALSALHSGGADIVIMDWKMDGMDGLECTRRIRAGVDGIDPRTPIILLTGVAGKDTETAAYAAGVTHFMEKPFSLKRLHAGVTKALNWNAGAP